MSQKNTLMNKCDAENSVKRIITPWREVVIYSLINILLLPEDILKLIIGYIIDDMDVTVLYNLTITCKAISKLIPTRRHFENQVLDCAHKRLLEKLNSYPNDLGRILIEMIKKEKLLIGGGYILQCITGDIFKDSDIDIFISSDRNDWFDIFITKVRDMLTSVFKLDCPSSPFYTIPIEDNSDYGVLKNIRRVLSMNIFGLKIQFILVWNHIFIPIIKHCRHPTYLPLRLEDFIENDFDLSLCKCWFDGDKIYSKHVINQMKRVGIMNSKELNQLVAKISKGARRERMMKRIEKYSQRGFTIINVTTE